jgi:hypothetical protein
MNLYAEPGEVSIMFHFRLFQDNEYGLLKGLLVVAAIAIGSFQRALLKTSWHALYTRHKANNDLLSRYGATMVARHGFLIASSYVGRDIVVAECPNLDRCSNLSGIGESHWKKVWESDCCDPNRCVVMRSTVNKKEIKKSTAINYSRASSQAVTDIDINIKVDSGRLKFSPSQVSSAPQSQKI